MIIITQSSIDVLTSCISIFWRIIPNSELELLNASSRVQLADSISRSAVVDLSEHFYDLLLFNVDEYNIDASHRCIADDDLPVGCYCIAGMSNVE